MNNNGLKIDFVNDVEAHFIGIEKTEVYYKTDSLRNILSNKYSALYRMEAKDIVDICEISKTIQFSWNDIISEAAQKSTKPRLYHHQDKKCKKENFFQGLFNDR